MTMFPCFVTEDWPSPFTHEVPSAPTLALSVPMSDIDSMTMSAPSSE